MIEVQLEQRKRPITADTSLARNNYLIKTVVLRNRRDTFIDRLKKFMNGGGNYEVNPI